MSEVLPVTVDDYSDGSAPDFPQGIVYVSCGNLVLTIEGDEQKAPNLHVIDAASDAPGPTIDLTLQQLRALRTMLNAPEVAKYLDV